VRKLLSLSPIHGQDMSSMVNFRMRATMFTFAAQLVPILGLHLLSRTNKRCILQWFWQQQTFTMSTQPATSVLQTYTRLTSQCERSLLPSHAQNSQTHVATQCTETFRLIDEFFQTSGVQDNQAFEPCHVIAQRLDFVDC
jgi:hypothetical protein